jgi:4-amino-4-deoxy-L-arabinose transferase-like glycosyltransferase
MDSEIEKISELLTGPTPQSSPSIWKWLLRFAWILPLLFLLLFPLVFANRGINNDEALIGQQIHSLMNKGAVSAEFFRDYPPFDGPIIIYNKLFVWLGAAISYALGWGLYQLRLISVFSGVAILVMLYFFLKSIETRRVAALACLVLLWSPVFWDQMTIFRPEMLVTALGFASFLILWEADMRRSVPLTALAGAFAGWSGLAHPVGLFFMVAGVVALVFEREFRLAVILVVAAFFAFIPYLTGLIIDWRSFFGQLFDNGVMASKIYLEWWIPFINLLSEHKRIFRSPSVYGLTVLFILSLFLIRKVQFRENRFFWNYLIALFILGAVAPFPKIIRYLLPVTPFFAIAIARVINSFTLTGASKNKVFGTLFLFWIGAFIIYGGYALGAAAFGERTAPREMEANRLLAAKMNKGALVIAPFDFVFEQIDNFTIQSWWGCEKASNDNMTPEFVERYALKHGVEYLIVNDIYLKKMKISPDELRQSFRLYTPIYMLPKRDRYLMGKIAKALEKAR